MGLILFIIILVLLSLYKSYDLSHLLKINQQAYKKEVQVLKEYQDKQEVEKRELQEKYDKDLKDLQNKYVITKRKLEEEKQKKIQIILKEDPEKLKERIEHLYGFKYKKNNSITP